MTETATDRARRFLALHHRDAPLVMPNPWDTGSARLLVSLGFEALATTSSGFAATLGRPDGGQTRDELLAHARALCAAVPVPVSADMERCFADDPAGVAESVALAASTGLAGCSVEDWGGEATGSYGDGLAVDRVRAAADAAHTGPVPLVLTARCEHFLRGRPDLAATIARLQAYQEAGADVLFAPGVTDAADLAVLVRAVDRPVNVLARPGVPPIGELARLGVARISTGGALAWHAYAAVVEAATELRDAGTYGFWSDVPSGLAAARAAFVPRNRLGTG
jgi:2-methylisocitrate lyase-like PEP mutase family enzyme